jgi:hypothetical protein
VAITQTKVVRIIGFGTEQYQQTLSTNIRAAGIVYNSATTALWLGVADDQGTITWLMSDINCQTEFKGEWDYPVFSFPGTIWDIAVTQRQKNNGQHAITTFIGDNLMVEFGFDEGIGQPIVARKFKLPWSFSSATRSVVGFGDGLPFPGSQTPSIAIARQITVGNQTTGELVLLDQQKKHPATTRYFPNIRGWQSQITSAGTVSAIALIDPFDSLDVGFLLGFAPGNDQPLSIQFPWHPNQRWSSGLAWTRVDASTTIGLFLVGSGQPGGPLAVRFVSMTNDGNFTLLPDVHSINSSSPLWIPEAPSFISSPATLSEPFSELWFAVQSTDGPVVYTIPYPNVESIIKRYQKNKHPEALPTRPTKSEATTSPVAFPFSKSATLCDPTPSCKLLSPDNVCQGKCCQTILPPGKHGLVSLCCRDCNLGNCVGNPGTCIH